MRVRSLPIAAAVLAALALPAAPASAASLKGVFHIGPGSYIRLRQPNSGPFFSNPYSAASDKTYTLLSSGSGGGLRTTAVQAPPSPAFDAKGNSLAGSIIKPTNFAGILFGLATTSAPSISVSGRTLSGQVNGLVAQWNKQTFKQGGKVSGTYNAKTHRYQLTWTSLVSGGPFNGFTGYWLLEGTYSAG
jgi:hypothetical protein